MNPMALRRCKANRTPFRLRLIPDVPNRQSADHRTATTEQPADTERFIKDLRSPWRRGLHIPAAPSRRCWRAAGGGRRPTDRI